MTGALLRIRNLAVQIRNRPLLRGIGLDFAATGFYVIMGPVGVGKSTLMSIFEGRRDDAVLSLQADLAEYGGRPLSRDNHPEIIKQATRSDQACRRITASLITGQIDTALSSDPRMLCLDEPCATVAHDEAMPILERLRDEAQRRAIVMVTHNSEHARLFADWMVLLGGGEIVEQNRPEQMFTNPQSAETKRFLRTGSMTIPRPDANARALAPEFRGVPDLGQDGEAEDGPIAWFIRRSFAVADAGLAGRAPHEVARILADAGISIAVLDRGAAPALIEQLETSGIRAVPVPEPAPDEPHSLRASLALAAHLHAELAQGHKAACLFADPARARMVTAVQLIRMGLTVQDAISLLNGRIAEPAFTLSDEQFLWDLELVLDLEAVSDPPQAADPASTRSPLQ